MGKRGADITNKKGDKRRGAPLGNRNRAKGPRLGRLDRPPIAPRSDPEAPRTVPRQRRKRAKSGGKDFQPGANSHDGEMFQRGADMLPRGNVTLFAKCVYNDIREELYRRCVRISRSGTNREALSLLEWLGNRIEGLPTKKIVKTETRRSVFVFTTRDGEEIPALPAPTRVDSGATPGAAGPEDAMILGTLARV